VFTWADGTTYQGHFFQDLKEGQGTVTYNDGSTFRGTWQSDQPLQAAFLDLEHDQDCELLVPCAAKNYLQDSYGEPRHC
jgi:hypothetical protein